jgi:hypothetical protein
MTVKGMGLPSSRRPALLVGLIFSRIRPYDYREVRLVAKIPPPAVLGPFHEIGDHTFAVTPCAHLRIEST